MHILGKLYSEIFKFKAWGTWELSAAQKLWILAQHIAHRVRMDFNEFYVAWKLFSHIKHVWYARKGCMTHNNIHQHMMSYFWVS